MKKCSALQRLKNINPQPLLVNGTSYRFEDLCAEHYSDIFDYSHDPVMYEHLEVSPPTTKDDIKPLVHKWLRRQTLGDCRYWVIRAHDTERIVGSAAILYVDENRKSAEWAYGLDPKIWGQGHVFAIQKNLLDYAFQKIGLNRIEGKTFENNMRARESALAVGMQYEGLARDYYCKDGHYHNAWLYSMLKCDYDYIRSSSSQKINQIEQNQVFNLIKHTLDAPDLTINSDMENTFNWDSLKHMALILKLQENFDISFDFKQISQMISVKDILRIVCSE